MPSRRVSVAELKKMGIPLNRSAISFPLSKKSQKTETKDMKKSSTQQKS